MKLQISFDGIDLDKAIEIATDVAPYADIIEIGTALIYHYGVEAVRHFKISFPEKIILADTKFVDQKKEIIELFISAGAHWITIMAGTSPAVIHATTTATHALNGKVMLDLTDANSMGQSAMEAKNLGVDALLFHQTYDEQASLVFLDKWDMIKGNTTLPIFVSAKINRENVSKIMSLQPDAIIIDSTITNAQDYTAQAAYFSDLINKS